MKKFIATVCVILTAALFSSCANSIETDAKRIAQLTCKAQKMSIKELMPSGSSLKEEVKKMKTELAAKYTDEAERKIFYDIYIRELRNCK
jgi:Na+-translocating ferredoxin:NAD+ oxidoreductase RnfG subunit